MSEFQDGATHTQIKDYVLEHTGLKVSSLYISQVKRKCGLEVGKNYNLPKSVDSKQPQCPPEKEKAISESIEVFSDDLARSTRNKKPKQPFIHGVASASLLFGLIFFAPIP